MKTQLCLQRFMCLCGHMKRVQKVSILLQNRIRIVWDARVVSTNFHITYCSYILVWHFPVGVEIDKVVI